MEFKTTEELFQRVVSEAWNNEAFKAQLVANPMDAIEELTGQRIAIPEGKKFVVRDQTDSNVKYINIPAANNMEDVELTEAELEAVSGGTGDNALFCFPSYPPQDIIIWKPGTGPYDPGPSTGDPLNPLPDFNL